MSKLDEVVDTTKRGGIQVSYVPYSGFLRDDPNATVSMHVNVGMSDPPAFPIAIKPRSSTTSSFSRFENPTKAFDVGRIRRNTGD